VAAEEWPKAKKLLKSRSVWAADNQRTVFAASKALTRRTAVGRMVVCVATSRTRQMSLGLSEGNGHIFILTHPSRPGRRGRKAKNSFHGSRGQRRQPGQRVH